MLINRLYEFGKGLAFWDQRFRLKLNENFSRTIVGAKGGPGIKVEVQKGEILISRDELEPEDAEEDPIQADPPAQGVVVKLVGTVAGGGKYSGNIYGGTMSTGTAGNAALPNGLTVGAPCLIINAMEDGQPTHWLRTNQYIEGIIAGSSAPGTYGALVMVNRGEARIASPVAFGANTERLTARTTTWTRTGSTSGTTTYGDTPIEVFFSGGCYYDDTAGTPALKEHIFSIVFAADGKAHSISAETDYTVDTPGTCA